MRAEVTIAKLHPNPTEGTVRVAYALPEGARTGLLLVYDKIGTLRRRVELVGATGDVELHLADLPAGYYHYTCSAGTEGVQTGTLVKLP